MDDHTAPSASRTLSCLETAVTRRDFVSVAGCSLMLAVVAACGGGDSPTQPGNPGGNPGGDPGGTPGGAITTLPRIGTATVSGQTWTIPVSGSALATTGGIALIDRADLIVVNTGNNTFRAFTSICTHQTTQISTKSGDNLRCPNHGSEFSSSSGAVLVGPSGTSTNSIPALRQFAATFNATTNAVVVTRS